MIVLNIYLVIFITLLAALIASFGQLLYKKGVPKRIEKIRHVHSILKNRYIWLGGAAYLVSLAIYLYALQYAPLSVAYPVFASSFIFIALVSALVLKERLSYLRMLGILLVFAGIVVVSSTI